jgi:hypothetical protein
MEAITQSLMELSPSRKAAICAATPDLPNISRKINFDLIFYITAEENSVGLLLLYEDVKTENQV